MTANLDDPYGLLAGLGHEGFASLRGAGGAGGAGGAAHAGAPWGGLNALWPPHASPGSAPAPAPAPLSRGAEEDCAQCGAQMRRGASDLEYVCGGCGLVVEGDTAEPEEDEAPRAEPCAARLRIVGPNSNQLQPDLYRSSQGSTAATQKKQIYEEYCAYRTLHVEAGGRALPLDACRGAAEHYNEVQRLCVKRSQNKKQIMAACLWHACIEIGFSPSKAEVAAFMQLPTRGIARGINFVRALVADGKMDVDVDADPCRPEITTLFAHLGLDGKAHAALREAVYEVVQTAIAHNIGTSSVLRSKVAGATYVVLRRCADRALVPKPLGLQGFCQDRIRKNTIERFTRHLDAYHSYFEDTYRRAGLDATPPRA